MQCMELLLFLFYYKSSHINFSFEYATFVISLESDESFDW